MFYGGKMTFKQFMDMVLDPKAKGDAMCIYLLAENLWKNILVVGPDVQWRAYERSPPHYILGVLGRNRFRACNHSDIPARAPAPSAPSNKSCKLINFLLVIRF